MCMRCFCRLKSRHAIFALATCKEEKPLCAFKRFTFQACLNRKKLQLKGKGKETLCTGVARIARVRRTVGSPS